MRSIFSLYYRNPRKSMLLRESVEAYINSTSIERIKKSVQQWIENKENKKRGKR